MTAPLSTLQRLGRTVAATAAVLTLATACGPSRSPGERLYSRHCTSCHGRDGGGAGLYLADEGADFLDGTWKYGGEPSQIEMSLISEDVRKHKSWGFTNQERRQLVEHVLFLRGENR